MSDIILRFGTIEDLGKFVRNVERGYYANVLDLTAKGSFSPQTIEHARLQYNAEVLKREDYKTDQRI